MKINYLKALLNDTTSIEDPEARQESITNFINAGRAIGLELGPVEFSSILNRIPLALIEYDQDISSLLKFLSTISADELAKYLDDIYDDIVKYKLSDPDFTGRPDEYGAIYYLRLLIKSLRGEPDRNSWAH
ncbi:MAG: hypothetical protein BGO31_14345 [Bacteroidetes bacterium 43-16]|nr:MAG: hypothetical protein BGO31_14345 [Bacteroidetes bacterium 43-16]